MARINVVVADKDKDYARGLVDFLLIRYSGRFEVICCNDDYRLREYLANNKASIDLLLIDPGMAEAARGMDAGCVTVFLAGEEPAGPGKEKGTEKEDTENHAVFKYQHGERLINQIMNVYARKNSRFSFQPAGSKRARVVAFYSAAGGTGKTALAVGSSLHSVWAGKSVFYLNLETTPSTDLFFRAEEGGSLSHVLFSLKNGGKNLAQKVDGARCQDCFHHGLYFFKPQTSALDLKEDLAGELRLLVNTLVLTGRYDRIFIDMSACLDDNSLAVLETCDEIMTVTTGDAVAVKKTGDLLKELRSIENSKGIELLRKIKVVVNMCEAGKNSGTSLPGFDGLGVYCEIPRVGSLVIPHHDKYGLDLDSGFGEAVYQLNAGL